MRILRDAATGASLSYRRWGGYGGPATREEAEASVREWAAENRVAVTE